MGRAGVVQGWAASEGVTLAVLLTDGPPRRTVQDVFGVKGR